VPTLARKKKSQRKASIKLVDTATDSGATIEQRDDLGKGDAALYAYWMGQDKIAEKEERKWIKRSREIVKRFRDERPDSPNSSQLHRMNILWANVETLKPTLYARTPKPDVERRFKDQDDTGRLAAEILERSIAYQLECGSFDDVMIAVVEDRLLPGRGIARVLYVPQFGEEIKDANPEFEESEEEGVVVDAEGDEPQATEKDEDEDEPDREVTYEEVIPSYVFWEDYREGPARKWKEVPWVRYRAFLRRDELIKRFKAKGKLVNLDYSPAGTPESAREEPPRDMFKKAEVHEYWDKVKKQVVWLAPGTPDLILDQIDDPLGLPDFFPNPDPLLATTTNDKRIPVPDYIEYQDQARELDTLTARIDRLTRALKVSGVYAGEEKQALQQLIDEGTENRLIPVKDWAAFMEKGGLEGLISWVPIKAIAETLIQLYSARDRVKETLYEITGMSDILRGATQPIETLGAQELKANFATRRIYPKQQSVARFARDMIRLIGQIICLHFEPKTLTQITGYPQLQPVPQVPPPPQQQPQLSVVGQGGMPQQPQQNPQFAQAMAQWQQAQQQAQQIQAQNAVLQQQFDAAVKLLREEGLQGFRLDIEADSTIAPDEQAEKAARTEFLGQFIPLMEQMAPLVMGNPPLASLGKELVLFGVRGFKTARPLEESIEKAFDALAQMPPQQSPGGKGAPQGKSPQELQMQAQETSEKTQVAREANQVKLLQVMTDAKAESQKTDMENQFHNAQLAMDKQRLDDERSFRAVRSENLEARSADKLP
jgi:hypothetical protein